MQKNVFLRTLAALLSMGFSATCVLAGNVAHAASFNDKAECARPAWLRIDAFVTTPMVGADVEVYDRAGHRLFKQTGATNDRGIFPARVSLPRDFRVTVTFNGNRQPPSTLQSLGQFTLSADVHDYDPAFGVVYVNPVTTLVSKVMDSQPRLNLGHAQARVRELLSLPASSALGASLKETGGYHSGYFSESAFAAAAIKHGGLHAYLEELAVQASEPKLLPLSFAATVPEDDNPIVNFIAQQLAGGAIEWAEGEGIGWVLQAAGISTPGATQAQIAQMQQSLADLQSSVEALSNQLAALNLAVLGKLSKVQYTQTAVPALALSTQVNGIAQALHFYAQGCPPLVPSSPASTPSTYCTSEKVTLLAALNTVSINQSFPTLATYMLDNQVAGVHGMLHLYSEALGESVPFFRASDSVRLQQMYTFWKAAQIQAAELEVELLHVNGAQQNPGGIAQLYALLGDAQAKPVTQGALQMTFTAEKKLIYPALPAGTVICTTDHTMWLITSPQGYYDGGPTVVYVGAPPGASIQRTAVTSPISIQNFNWISPSVTEAQAFVSGWSGSSVNQWLTNNTQSTTTPTSSGFGWYLGQYPIAGHQTMVTPSTVWTRDSDSALDLNDGHIVTVKTNTFNWILVDRQLASEEQYYWYPGQ